MQSFFLSCAGVEKEFSDNAYEAELNRLTILGKAVFYTSVISSLAFLHGSLMVIEDYLGGGFDGLYYFLVAFLSVFWGLIIFNIEQFIIKSMSYSGSKVSEFAMGAPRLLIAVFLSAVIATPLNLLIFNKEIDAQIFNNMTTKLSALDKEYNRKIAVFDARKEAEEARRSSDNNFDIDVKNLANERESLALEISNISKRATQCLVLANTFRNEAKLEEQGKGASGKSGCGQKCREFIEKADRQDSICNNHPRKVRLSQLTGDVDSLSSSIRDKSRESEKTRNKLAIDIDESLASIQLEVQKLTSEYNKNKDFISTKSPKGFATKVEALAFLVFRQVSDFKIIADSQASTATTSNILPDTSTSASVSAPPDSAPEKIYESPYLGGVVLTLFALFFFLDLTPFLVKLFSNKGQYDLYLQDAGNDDRMSKLRTRLMDFDDIRGEELTINRDNEKALLALKKERLLFRTGLTSLVQKKLIDLCSDEEKVKSFVANNVEFERVVVNVLNGIDIDDSKSVEPDITEAKAGDAKAGDAKAIEAKDIKFFVYLKLIFLVSILFLFVYGFSVLFQAVSGLEMDDYHKMVTTIVIPMVTLFFGVMFLKGKAS